MPVAERRGNRVAAALYLHFHLHDRHCLLIPKSARGLAHSKTLPELKKVSNMRQLLECGSLLPLFTAAPVISRAPTTNY